MCKGFLGLLSRHRKGAGLEPNPCGLGVFTPPGWAKTSQGAAATHERARRAKKAETLGPETEPSWGKAKEGGAAKKNATGWYHEPPSLDWHWFRQNGLAMSESSCRAWNQRETSCLARVCLAWFSPKLLGGLEHEFYLSIYWEKSSQLTFIFFRGVGIPPTSKILRPCQMVLSYGPIWSMTRPFAVAKASSQSFDRMCLCWGTRADGPWMESTQ